MRPRWLPVSGQTDILLNFFEKSRNPYVLRFSKIPYHPLLFRNSIVNILYVANARFHFTQVS